MTPYTSAARDCWILRLVPMTFAAVTSAITLMFTPAATKCGTGKVSVTRATLVLVLDSAVPEVTRNIMVFFNGSISQCGVSKYYY